MMCNIWGKSSSEAHASMLFKNQRLLKAAKRGDTAGVVYAISQGANLSYQEPWDGNTALHLAVINTDRKICRVLLNSGLDILPAVTRIRDFGGYTALHWASIYQKTEIVRMLVQADPDSAYTVDRMGRTPLHWAIHYNYTAVSRVLIDGTCNCEQDLSRLVDSHGQRQGLF